MFYDYQCSKCGKIVEISCQSYKDRPNRIECDCGGSMTQRISAPGIIVKGGASPPKSAGRPPGAIPMGSNVYAVPRRDKRGRVVRLKDLKSRQDLPQDMQKQYDKKTEKDQRGREAGKKTFGSKYENKKHWQK